MMLTNYLMVRVLVPWALLYPLESGLSTARGVKPSVCAHNCQVLASLVYLVIRVLRPELTPPNTRTINEAAREEIELAKASVAEDSEEEEEEGAS
ncbi:unnamed protein product, partial [Discosporangium mesarthrocarpum]